MPHNFSTLQPLCCPTIWWANILSKFDRRQWWRIHPHKLCTLHFVRKSYRDCPFDELCMLSSCVCFEQRVESFLYLVFSLTRAEDNDDLVSILDATAPVLKRDYGPYYISEIILNTTSNRAIIVAEVSCSNDELLQVFVPATYAPDFVSSRIQMKRSECCAWTPTFGWNDWTTCLTCMRIRVFENARKLNVIHWEPQHIQWKVKRSM